jgi:hypothetical protein
MSHTVQVKNIQCKNEAALETACDALGLELSSRAKHQLFGGNKAEGRAVRLPGWNYPVIINTETGEASYDNYGGSWGKQEELDRLIQRYSVEAAKMEALAHGYSVDGEEALADGSIKLSLANYAGV